MARTIGDPILLRECRGGVDHELLSFLIVLSSGLHLDCVVAIAELCEAEATHVGQVIYFFHEGPMAVCVQGHESSTEEVELHGEFGCK